MPQGLQVYNASGQLLVDLTDRLSRLLGIATLTNPTDGNLTDAGFATGTPWWVCLPISGGSVSTPAVSIAGNVLSWDFDASGNYATTYKLIYGVY
jgi:hypothetical protein